MIELTGEKAGTSGLGKRVGGRFVGDIETGQAPDGFREAEGEARGGRGESATVRGLNGASPTAAGELGRVRGVG